MRRAALLLALCVWTAPAQAEDAPRLSLPLDCAIGADCAILQYADLDPGAGVLDRACGPLSYDGHGGTDFYLLRLGLLETGVPVLAARTAAGHPASTAANTACCAADSRCSRRSGRFAATSR